MLPEVLKMMPEGEGSSFIFKPEVAVFHYTDRPRGKCLCFLPQGGRVTQMQDEESCIN